MQSLKLFIVRLLISLLCSSAQAGENSKVYETYEAILAHFKKAGIENLVEVKPSSFKYLRSEEGSKTFKKHTFSQIMKDKNEVSRLPELDYTMGPKGSLARAGGFAPIAQAYKVANVILCFSYQSFITHGPIQMNKCLFFPMDIDEIIHRVVEIKEQESIK